MIFETILAIMCYTLKYTHVFIYCYTWFLKCLVLIQLLFVIMEWVCLFFYMSYTRDRDV